MKVKIFTTNSDIVTLENEVNKWLAEQTYRSIEKILVAQSGRLDAHRTVYIFYT